MEIQKPDDQVVEVGRFRATELATRPAGGLPQHPALNAAPDALALLKALRRRWPLAIGLGLLLAAVAGPAAWYLVPKDKYRASATLQVSSRHKHIMFPIHNVAGGNDTYQANQAALIKNRSVLGHALNKPRIAKLATIREHQPDPEDWLETQLSVGYVGKSEILEVALVGDHPHELAEIVNAIIDSYANLILAEEREELTRRLAQLGKVWEDFEEQANAKRSELKKIAEAAAGSTNSETRALMRQFQSAQLNTSQGELLRVKSDLARTRSILEVLTSQTSEEPGTPDAPTAAATPPPPTIDESLVDRHPDVIRLHQRVDELAHQYRSAYRLSGRDSDPAVARLQRQWNEAKRSLELVRFQARQNLRSKHAAGTTSPITADGADPAEAQARELARLHAEIQVLENYQATLENSIQALRAEVARSEVDSVDLEIEKDEFDVTSEVARKVRSQMEAIAIELEAPGRVQLRAAAKPPTRRDETKRLKAAGTAAFGSFALAIVGVAFLEFRARRVDTADEIANGLGLKLVGALPGPPARRRSPRTPDALVERRWQSQLVESIDATRTMLLHASRSQAVRVVAITSAVKGEGKTSLCCHLGASLARSGRRTLIIDCDLRSPALHQLFDLVPGPGLSEVLKGKSQLEDVIQKTSAEGLDLVSAGSSDSLAVQLLARIDLRALFEELKVHYDFVLVDCPPVLPVTDALLIGQNVDGMLFSILRGVSRLPQVHTACERQAALGTRILGAVINGVPAEESYATSDYAMAPSETQAV